VSFPFPAATTMNTIFSLPILPTAYLYIFLSILVLNLGSTHLELHESFSLSSHRHESSHRVSSNSFTATKLNKTDKKNPSFTLHVFR
jgi:hypothetical protein